MQSTEPRVLMEVADGDVRYVVFTPLDEEAREVLSWVVQGQPLLEGGVAFADGQAVWVLEEGNHADYVYQSLLCTGIEMCWPSGESLQLSQEALDDYDEVCESILVGAGAAPTRLFAISSTGEGLKYVATGGRSRDEIRPGWARCVAHYDAVIADLDGGPPPTPSEADDLSV